MTAQEVQDLIHVFSIFSFRDGKKEPGICINRYNVSNGKIEYFFIHQYNMHEYKNAFERHDKENCRNLCTPFNPEQVASIKPVSLAEYKAIMELLEERGKLISSHHKNGFLQ